MKKICFKCEIEKDLFEFYKHAQMKDGHLNKCINCTKSDVRKHRIENDSMREYDRSRYYNQIGRRNKINITTQEWINKNPEARKAHIILNNAVRDKKIIKQPCKVCGSIYRIHGHHNDYSKPLEVEWFCAKHHQRFHVEMIENAS